MLAEYDFGEGVRGKYAERYAAGRRLVAGSQQPFPRKAAMPALTLDQFLKQEETKPASEYACGEAFQKPMPNRDHSSIQVFLAAVLFQFLTQNRLGRIFTEFRCIFGPPGRERTYVPDLSYVANDRLTRDRHLNTAPTLAIEVLSPGQHLAHFLDKIQFYLLKGVRLIWILDPTTETVTVQAPGEEAQILRPGDTLDGRAILPGFSVLAAEIFEQIR